MPEAKTVWLPFVKIASPPESRMLITTLSPDISGALHDTVSRPEIAANVDSTGQNKGRHVVKRDGSL